MFVKKIAIMCKKGHYLQCGSKYTIKKIIKNIIFGSVTEKRDFFQYISKKIKGKIDTVKGKKIEKEFNEFVKNIRNTDVVFLIFSSGYSQNSKLPEISRLVQYLLKGGMKVIYVCFEEFESKDSQIFEMNKNFIRITGESFLRIKERFFEMELQENKKKCLLFDFPYRKLIEIIDISNCFGWKTIYVMKGEWGEILPLVKKKHCYDGRVEEWILNQVNVSITLSSNKYNMENTSRNMYVCNIDNIEEIVGICLEGEEDKENQIADLSM